MITLNSRQREQAQEIAAKALPFVEGREASLSASMIRYLWFGGNPADVVPELAAFQNDDGGFGRRLEPDIHAPASNPFAARLAMQTLLCIPMDESTEIRNRLGTWLAANQNPDGDWHFSEETRAGSMQPWFTGWEFPSVNPACCLLGWAGPLGMATDVMSARVAKLFASKASVEAARSASFYELLPYVEYSLAVTLPDGYLDAIAKNICAVGEQFEDAGHFFDLAIGGSDDLTSRIPEELSQHWLSKLLSEPLEDGGWPSPYNDAWRDWTTASNLVTLARMRGNNL